MHVAHAKRVAVADVLELLGVHLVLTFAAGYNVLQRVYKSGGQPGVRKALTTRDTERAQRACGGNTPNVKLLIHMFVASLAIARVCSWSRYNWQDWQTARRSSSAITTPRARSPRRKSSSYWRRWAVDNGQHTPATRRCTATLPTLATRCYALIRAEARYTLSTSDQQ